MKKLKELLKQWKLKRQVKEVNKYEEANLIAQRLYNLYVQVAELEKEKGDVHTYIERKIESYKEYNMIPSEMIEQEKEFRKYITDLYNCMNKIDEAYQYVKKYQDKYEG